MTKSRKKIVSKKGKDTKARRNIYGINEVFVSGYKSIKSKQKIGINLLTILAGTNSVGKSSFIQPLLLMKQTLEESFDPGPLLLNGPHVRFFSSDEFLHKDINGEQENYFTIGFRVSNGSSCDVKFSKNSNGFEIDYVDYRLSPQDSMHDKEMLEFRLAANPGYTTEELDSKTLNKLIPPFLKDVMKSDDSESSDLNIDIQRDRCLLKANVVIGGEEDGQFFKVKVAELPSSRFDKMLRSIIHLPGLRGNPERNYPSTAVDIEKKDSFLPGNFEKYVASIITKWQSSDPAKLSELEYYLNLLGLTNRVKTVKINDTQVSINVGRGIHNSESDFVNIADVGLGVSQTLPVLVALIYAKPGQMVYIEQPELHLHPRAQYMFSKILSRVMAKGVRVVIETHSSLILKGIQTAVASNEMSRNRVALHWFSKEKTSGETTITSTKLDKNGAFGDWPVDFDEIELMAEIDYLGAVEIDD
ncbi:AAA family ATPase [Paenibacillus alvei]